MRAEAPYGAEGNVLEVDNRSDGRDGGRRGRVRKVGAEPEDKPCHGLVEGNTRLVSGAGKRMKTAHMRW